MALQFTVEGAAFDALPDDVKKLYKKRDDGKFQLEVEGATDKAKLDEFRTTNVSLKEKLEAQEKALASFKDIDPAKYKALMEKFQSDEEKKLMKDGNVDEIIKLRTAGIIKDRDEQLAAKDQIIKKLNDEKTASVKEKDTYIVEAEMRKVLDNPELGFQPGVANILKDTVLREFVHKDGKVIRIKPDGSVVYGSKDGEPQGLAEFVQSYSKEHPYLVKPSSGGGAGNKNDSKAGANGNVKTIKRADFEKLDPFKQQTFVTTEKGVVVD
jgi:hypothetical protein